MSKFPSGVTEAIGQGIGLYLWGLNRTCGPDGLAASDLSTDLVKSLKWIHSVDPERAVTVASSALLLAQGREEDPLGISLKDGLLCLEHSLTQHSGPYGKWSPQQAAAFTGAVMRSVVDAAVAEAGIGALPALG